MGKIVKKLILSVIVFLLIIGALACEQKNKAKAPPVKKSAKKVSEAKKTGVDIRREEALFRGRLRETIMPATDVIQQVRDAASGVVSGDTKPDLAVAIYDGADRLLTETRIKLTELTAPKKQRHLKDKSSELLKNALNELGELIDFTNAQDSEKIISVVKRLDDNLDKLRSVAEIDAPNQPEKKSP